MEQIYKSWLDHKVPEGDTVYTAGEHCTQGKSMQWILLFEM